MGIVSHRTKWKKNRVRAKLYQGPTMTLTFVIKKTQTQAKVAAHPLPTLCFSKV